MEKRIKAAAGNGKVRVAISVEVGYCERAGEQPYLIVSGWPEAP
jgi:hypothetical protein